LRKTAKRRGVAATLDDRGDSRRGAPARDSARMIIENWRYLSGMFQAQRAARGAIMLPMACEVIHRCLWNVKALEHAMCSRR
jgi:hypothetical protein